VARNDDWNWVLTVGEADSPDSLRPLDPPCDLTVRNRDTNRDLPKHRPDFLLENSAKRRDCDVCQGVDLSLEIAGQRLRESRWILGFLDDQAGDPATQPGDRPIPAMKLNSNDDPPSRKNA
jgi:hypothetical protein